MQELKRMTVALFLPQWRPLPFFLALQLFEQKPYACGSVLLAQSVDGLRYDWNWLLVFVYIPRETRISKTTIQATDRATDEAASTPERKR
jgi:hypothetical protein